MSTLKVLSPYDGHFIKEVPFSDEKRAEAMMSLAYKTFLNRDNWLRPYERKAILQNALQSMEKNLDDLARQSAEEGGKPFTDSLIEAKRAANGFQIAIEHIAQLKGTEIPMNQDQPSAHHIAYTYREAAGVVMAISAFNHPINLIVHQVIPAVAVGAPVLIKPASSTPISCFNIVNLLYEAGLPKAWCQVICCENKIAEKLVSDPRTSFFSFIGSAKVGWYLRSKLPPGAGCALEHGGAAPVIFEPDADVEQALPGLVKAGFYHAGQVCVSVQRVFVHEDICQQFAEGMAAMAKKLVVGDPVNPKTEVGPLIAKKEVDRIHEWVQEATQKGALLLCGGKKISETCYAPTVLLNPPQDAKVSQQEIFGPVVCVYSYKNRLKAIELANSLDYSFQAAVYTKNLDVALDTVRRLNATAVMVNEHTAFRVDWMPFGGRRSSGLGMGGIPYSMHDMSHEKMMVIKSSVL